MPTRLQWGVRLPNDGMWLEGPSESEEQSDSGDKNGAELKHAFDEQRIQNCHHLLVWKDKNRV